MLEVYLPRCYNNNMFRNGVIEMKYILFYIIALNIIGFITMGIDKSRARHNKWRISELSLLLWAAAGGSLGSLLGMLIFHHKTKHAKFFIGIPSIIIIQFFLIYHFNLFSYMRL